MYYNIIEYVHVAFVPETSDCAMFQDVTITKPKSNDPYVCFPVSVFCIILLHREWAISGGKHKDEGMSLCLQPVIVNPHSMLIFLRSMNSSV